MSRKTRKTLMTVAVNAAAYGDDAIQAGTPVAIQTSGLDITPLEGTEIDRELDTGELGNTQQMLVGTHVKASFTIELAGANDAANTPPAFDAIIQGAGFVGTDQTTSYEYSRISDNTEPDITSYIYKDGAIHKITGARLTKTTKIMVGEIPKIECELTGLYGGIVSGSLPVPDFSGFTTPVKVGATNTTFKMGGSSGTAAELSLLEFEWNENNEITWDENTVDERVYLTNFTPDGKIVVEAPDLGTFDPFSLALSETLQYIEVTHGIASGNIATIVLPQVQLGRPTYADKDGRMTYDIPFRVIGATHTLAFS